MQDWKIAVSDERDKNLPATNSSGGDSQADESVTIIRETTTISSVTVTAAVPASGDVAPGKSKVPLFVILGGVALLLGLAVVCCGANLLSGGGSNPESRASEPVPAETDAGKQSGTLIGSYDVVMVGGYSIPLGDAAPAQAQFDENCKTGDLCRNGSINAFFPVSTDVKLYTIANHFPPTYSVCKGTTLSAERVELAVGQTFCLLKKGRVIGISIWYGAGAATTPVKFTTTVWADSAGSTPVAEPAPTGPAPGSQVGTYSVSLVPGSVPLTDSKPDTSQYDLQCNSGDICRHGSIGAFFPVGIAVELYTLEGATPPSYQACKTTTLNSGRISFEPGLVGHSFCVLRPGRVIAVTFTSMPRTATDPVDMAVTVWADSLA